MVSPPGSSVHGISQARLLKRVAWGQINTGLDFFFFNDYDCVCVVGLRVLLWLKTSSMLLCIYKEK